MFLQFSTPYHPEKWYSRTPTGEFAFSDFQGLYEWRDSERIQYSGGDRQASDHNGRWYMSGNGEPNLRGFAAATSGVRVN